MDNNNIIIIILWTFRLGKRLVATSENAWSICRFKQNHNCHVVIIIAVIKRRPQTGTFKPNDNAFSKQFRLFSTAAKRWKLPLKMKSFRNDSTNCRHGHFQKNYLTIPTVRESFNKLKTNSSNNLKRRHNDYAFRCKFTVILYKKYIVLIVVCGINESGVLGSCEIH